jgi:hypothetical protein
VTELRHLATCTDYAELHQALRARVAELGISCATLNALAEITYADKLLAPPEPQSVNQQMLSALKSLVADGWRTQDPAPPADDAEKWDLARAAIATAEKPAASACSDRSAEVGVGASEGASKAPPATADDTETPDWDDLRGAALDATGELTSEAFVRALRDSWGK